MLKTATHTTMYARFVTVAIAGAALIGFGYLVRWQSGAPVTTASSARSAVTAGPAPEQTTVSDAAGNWQATFTKGARTVLMRGPERTFTEPSSTDATIKTIDWVRVYPSEFDGVADRAWLARMADQNAKQSTPDLIQTAMQYIAKANTIKDASGRVIAADASYGPEQSDDKRQEGSDFNDFMGIPYTYGSIVDKPEPAQFGSLDCSGFMRMIWGYRNGLPLGLEPSNAYIPRRAYQILDSAPGIVVIPNTKHQVTDFSRLQVGDIVFHDASDSDGNQVDHLGMYLGIDSQGNHRFISSRKTANGPTFGDLGGRSVLDGKGLYAETFRAIRRF